MASIRYSHKKSGKTYASVAESYREGKKVKSRHLFSLGEVLNKEKGIFRKDHEIYHYDIKQGKSPVSPELLYLVEDALDSNRLSSEKQKVLVITGSSHGIGKATARYFQAQGWKVFGIDLNPGSFFRGDIADPKTIEAFVQAILKQTDHVDLLVNNAKPDFIGIGACSYEQFLQAQKVGVAAPFYLSKLLLSYFVPGASIINISSTRSEQSMPESESYAAAKGGIQALSHAMAISLGPKIRVNSISPGWIETETDPEKIEYSKGDMAQHPAGRVGKVQDIVYLIDFLQSDKAGFITGENIKVDGGMSRLMIYHDEHGWSHEPETEQEEF